MIAEQISDLKRGLKSTAAIAGWELLAALAGGIAVLWFAAALFIFLADRYDALTASDRPYKKAMPAEKPLDILAGDVKRGQLDAALFDVFAGARVWDITTRRER